jgi:hypothetical protein
LVRLVAVMVAGWVPVMTGTTQTLAFRMRDVADGAPWAASYSVVTAVGWLASIVALVAAGLLHDRGTRTATASAAAPTPMWLRAVPVVLLAAAALVATADGTAGVAAGWILLQLPSAALVTVASARLAAVTPPGRRWLAAVVTGSGPGLGLALGSALVAVTGPAPLPSVLLPAAVATALTLPALRRGDLASEPVAVAPTAGAARTARRGLALLLVAVALVDGGLATGLVYAVPAVDRALAVPFDVVSALTSRLVLLATLLTLLGNVLGGALARFRGGATAGFTLSALSLGAATLLLAGAGSEVELTLAFAVAGLAAGVSNGTTFALYLDTAVDSGSHGSGLGWLNAVPTIPFVLVPAIAAPLLRSDPVAGVGTVLVIGAVACAASALLAVTAGARTWRRAADLARLSAPAPRS